MRWMHLLWCTADHNKALGTGGFTCRMCTGCSAWSILCVNMKTAKCKNFWDQKNDIGPTHLMCFCCTHCTYRRGQVSPHSIARWVCWRETLRSLVDLVEFAPHGIFVAAKTFFWGSTFPVWGSASICWVTRDMGIFYNSPGANPVSVPCEGRTRKTTKHKTSALLWQHDAGMTTKELHSVVQLVSICKIFKKNNPGNDSNPPPSCKSHFNAGRTSLSWCHYSWKGNRTRDQGTQVSQREGRGQYTTWQKSP